jgi:hypothetical protein
MSPYFPENPTIYITRPWSIGIMLFIIIIMIDNGKHRSHDF